MDGSVSEHLLAVSLRSDAHVLLAQRLHVRSNVGMLLESWLIIRPQLYSTLIYRENVTYQLLRQRDLLKLHLMDAGRGGPQQRTGREKNCGLHGCDNNDRTIDTK